MIGTITILQGVPGSGKTSWADSQQLPVISREKIREQLYGKDKKYLNLRPNELSEVSEKELLLADQHNSFVVDAVNITNKEVSRWNEYACARGLQVEYKEFPISLEEALERNKSRQDKGEKVYSDKTVEKIWKSSVDENGEMYSWGYSKSRGEAYKEPKHSENKAIIEQGNLTLAEKYPLLSKNVAVIDIDGTLANNSHHVSQYLKSPPKKDFTGFFKAISTAPVNTEVLRMIRSLREEGIPSIVLTGRSDYAAKELLDFLNDNDVPISRVIVRPHENTMRDFEFKERALQELSKEGITPVIALDDRPRSVEMWEKLGIPVEKVEWRDEVMDWRTPAPQPKTSGPLSEGRCIKCGRALKSGTIGPSCRRKL